MDTRINLITRKEGNAERTLEDIDTATKYQERKLVVPIFGQVIYIAENRDMLGMMMGEAIGFDHSYYGFDGKLYVLELKSKDERQGQLKYIMALLTDDMQTIIHESVHAAMKIAKQLGFIIDLEDHEIVAYLTEYIATEAKKIRDRVTQINQIF